jgi:DNA/RNA endonuclease G (NUC1)
MVGVKASDPYSAQGGFSPLLKVTGPNMSNAAITTTFNELALLSYGGVTPPGPVLRERGLKPEKPESQVEQLFEEAMILRNNGREKAGYKTDESRQELMDRLGEQNPMRGFMWGLFKDSGDYYKESTEHVKEALNYAKNFNPDVDTSMFKVMTSDERNKEKDFQKVREMVSSYETVSFNNNHIAPHIGALPNGVQVLEKRGFMVAYDKDNKRNMFVGYVISPETDSAARDDFDFKADPAVKEEYRGTAFKNSGQDQGHFIAAAIAGALGGDEGAADSYLSTNIGAQRSEFNRMGGAYYTQEFEYQERAKKEEQSYYVLKGALPSDRRIGSGPDNTVENPDKFWSIYMKKGADGWEIDGFVLDEDTIRYENAEHHVQKLEEMSEILGVDLSQVINDVSEVR